MIQGKVSIETRNVHTGRVDKVEHCNTFQSSVIQSWFNPYGRQATTPYTFNSDGGGVYNPIWSKLVGGILLFDTTLTPGSVTMPAGVKMVGNGSYKVTNSGTPSELGSYNELEEIIGANALTMVYDYTTSQANGTIASVCLTSDVGGYIGYGNPSGGYHATRKHFLGVQNANASNTALPKRPFGMDANGVIYAIDTNRDFSDALKAGSLPLYYYDSDFAKYDLITSASAGKTAKTKTLSVSGYNFDYWNNGAFAWLDERYLCVCNFQNYASVAPNATFAAIIIDTQGETVTAYTVTNNTGETIRTTTYNGDEWTLYNSVVWADTDTLIINLRDSNNDLVSYAMKLSTNTPTLLGEITDIATLTPPASRSSVMHQLQMSQDLIFCDSWVFDKVNNTFYPHNGLFMPNDNLSPNTVALAVADGGKTLCGARSAYDYQQFAHNPLMLSTIANLDSAVTKTSSLAMKVTYTLTRS